MWYDTCSLEFLSLYIASIVVYWPCIYSAWCNGAIDYKGGVNGLFDEADLIIIPNYSMSCTHLTSSHSFVMVF